MKPDMDNVIGLLCFVLLVIAMTVDWSHWSQYLPH